MQLRMPEVLFSAPYKFFKNKLKKIKRKKVIFKEIWEKHHPFMSKDIKIWIVNPGQKFIINKNILDYFPNLKIIATPSTGSNHINLNECKKKNIKVISLLSNRKRLNDIRASSEFTFLLILNSLRRIQNMENEIRSGNWRDNEDKMRGNELFEKKVGIVGLGRIGTNVASWCNSFGAKVCYYDPFKKIKKYEKRSLVYIFKNCDIISISAELNKKTKDLIDNKLLNKLKNNSHLINTSRGEIINQNHLMKFIRKTKKKIYVTTDVLSGEVKGKPLNKNVVKLHESGKIFITPHVAGATYESQFKAAQIVIEQINKINE